MNNTNNSYFNPPSPVGNKKAKKKGIRFRDVVIFIFVAIGVLMFAMSVMKENGYLPEKKEVSVISVQKGNTFYYDQLSDDEQAVYMQLLNTAKSGEMYCEIEYDNSSRMPKIVYALTNDHPELYWVYWYGFQDMDIDISAHKTRVKLQLLGYKSLWDYSSDTLAQSQKLQEAVQQIVTLANKLPTDEEKARFVHDYLILTSSYSYNELDKYYNSKNGDKYDYIFTAYGCLVEHKCVCAGYAKAYQLIMNELGIECSYITGKTNKDFGDANHAWNCIDLEKQNYFTDVTWDDPDLENYVSYDYYCISTKHLLESRDLDEEYFSYVICPEDLMKDAEQNAD